MWYEKKNPEEGRTRKVKVTCDATQIHPTPIQPILPPHALQVCEGRIRPKTRKNHGMANDKTI